MGSNIKEGIQNILDREVVWRLANQTLYDFFRNHFTHETDEVIIAKTWMLGRTYAVALERRRKNKGNNQEFYRDHVTRTFKKSSIGSELTELRHMDPHNKETIDKVLRLHHMVSKEVNTISGQNRSFSSKYLHFHLHNHFFIFDSVAKTTISKLLRGNQDFKEFRRKYHYDYGFDKEYFAFFVKCLFLQERIYEKTGNRLSKRKIDDILLGVKDEEIDMLSKMILQS